MLTALKNYATPPSTLARRLSIQSLLFASGDGTFLAGSAVFFTLVVGLSLGRGGHRPHDRGGRELHRRGADGQARRPLRPQADVDPVGGGAGRAVPGVAVHRQLPGVRRARRGDGGRGHPRRHRARRLRHRHPAAGGAGGVARLPLLRAQRRLQHRRLPRRGRDRLRHRGPAVGAAGERGAVPPQQRGDPPAARRHPRRAQLRAAGEARGHPRHPQPQLDRGHVLHRASCGPTRCCCTRSSPCGW